MDMGKKEEGVEERGEEEGDGGGTVRTKWICYVTLERYIFQHKFRGKIQTVWEVAV